MSYFLDIALTKFLMYVGIKQMFSYPIDHFLSPLILFSALKAELFDLTGQSGCGGKCL